MNGVSMQIGDDVARITFMAPVSPESIYALIANIETAFSYYQTRVDIKLHSPGGDTQILRYVSDRIQEWQKAGNVVGTTAMAECSSAAASMLSLGSLGYRRASLNSRLLYHRPRVEAEPALSAEMQRIAGIITAKSGAGVIKRLEELERRISREDDYLNGLVTNHIAQHIDSPISWFSLERNRRAQLLSANRNSLIAAANRGSVPIDSRDAAHLSDATAALQDPGLANNDAFEVLQTIFSSILDRERPTNPLVIWALLLLDHVDGLDLGTPLCGGAK